MKHNQLFYNYEGLFRYLKLGRMLQQRLQQVSPGTDRFVERLVERRLDNCKWRQLGAFSLFYFLHSKSEK